jgi:hypothetical protein
MPPTYKRAVTVTPSAARLTSSLRDIGYDFVAAVADLVDNSVSADADRIDVEIRFHGSNSFVFIADNGTGMAPAHLNEALRFGSRRTYDEGDLGRFGLGLKTASLSQCRRVMVVTRSAPNTPRLNTRVLDLDHIESTDRWEILNPGTRHLSSEVKRRLAHSTGTVVIWDRLDRVLNYADPSGAWAKRRLEKLASDTRKYLAMVFHRFLAGEVPGRSRVQLRINDAVVSPWDPFARAEPATRALPELVLPVRSAGRRHQVRWRPFVLPPRDQFSSAEAFEHFGGINRWNRHQGIYAYRENRMIQHGGWAGLRTMDEHTKLARVALDFDNTADAEFSVDVAKRRISLPTDLRGLLERPVSTLCSEAQAVYRSSSETKGAPSDGQRRRSGGSAAGVGFSLMAAALSVGEEEALDRIFKEVRRTSPDIGLALGLPSETL